MTGEAQIAVALAGTGAQVRPASPPDSVGGVPPSCVATPTTLDQAAGVMQAAAGLELAVVPRGGGRTISWGVRPGPVRRHRGHGRDGPDPRVRGR